MRKTIFLFAEGLVILLLFLVLRNLNIPLPNVSFSSGEQTPKQEIKPTTILLGGDVMLGRSVMTTALDEKKSAFYPFEKIQNVLSDADITMVNLESPVVSDCPRITGGFIFCGNYQMGEDLALAGIDIVTLANNHTLNFGQEGLIETQNFLLSQGVDYVGQGNLVIKQINGTKFGFLGFDFTLASLNDEELNLIRESKISVDVLIVAAHWGEEYQPKANYLQKNIAENMVQSGADIIIGSHPHWVEDSEYIEGKPVYYSLGNLVFDQMWSEETRKGLLLKLTFEDGKIINTQEIYTYMSDFAQPQVE